MTVTVQVNPEQIPISTPPLTRRPNHVLGFVVVNPIPSTQSWCLVCEEHFVRIPTTL
jgi:hypothetical protein